MGAGGTYPAYQLSFAPGVDANTVPTAGQWVDISDRLRSFSVKYGSEDQFSHPSAGTMTLTLDNADGNLDPDNTSGTWYGNLKPLMWFRLMGGTTTASEGVFYGQVSIDGFQLSASQFPGRMEVTVTVLDAVEQLANTDLPESVWEYEVSALSPEAWWRLGETSGTVAVDSAGNRTGTYAGGATFNTRGSLVAGSSDAAIEFVDSAVMTAPSAIDSYPYTVVVPFATTDADRSSVRVLFQDREGPRLVSVFIEGTGALEGMLSWTAQSETGVVRSGGTDYVVDDQDAHLAILVAENATTMTLYVDGSTSGTSVATTGAPLAPTGTGTVYVGAEGSGVLPARSTVDDVVVFDAALTAAQVTTLWEAFSAPWEGDTTGERAERILDLANVPATTKAVDVTTTTMPSATLNSQDAWTALTDAAMAEGGRVFVDHNNTSVANVMFRDHDYRWNLSSSATFGDGGGSEVPYSGVDLQDDVIINTVTASRFGGSESVVEDATSRATYKPRDYSLTGILVDDDTYVVHRAAALVAEKKDRHRRVRSITLEPAGDSHPAWNQVFARRIDDRITVKWRPPYGGTYSYECWIIGCSHEWTQGDDRPWRTTFWLEPVPYDADAEPYWIAGVSTAGVTTRAGW